MNSITAQKTKTIARKLGQAIVQAKRHLFELETFASIQQLGEGKFRRISSVKQLFSAK